jgi:hypothetical protein
MRSNRRKNWLIKRIALGFAVAALAAPAAQARVDEGGQAQSSSTAVAYQAFVTDFPFVKSSPTANAYRAFVTDFPSVKSSPLSVASVADVSFPRAMPIDYALSKGDQIEAVRAEPRGASSDRIEFVRSMQPRAASPALVVSRFGRPNATTNAQLEAIDYKDVGIGAGLVLGLVLLGGAAGLSTRHLGREQTA